MISWWTNVQKDEAWLITEVNKAWVSFQAGEEKIKADVKGIFDYIAAHQTQIDNIATAILSDVSLLAGLAGHPEVGAVAATVVTSAKAIADLAAGIDKGNVHLPDLVSALHGVKDAQSAVNALVKVATAQPPAAS